MQSFLQRPYNFNRNENNRVKSIFGISLGLFLFLLLFNPFDFDEIEIKNQVYYFFGFAVFTLITLTIDLLLVPKLFNQKFLEEKWKMQHEILWNIMILLSLAGAYYGFVCVTKIMPINYTGIVNLLLLATLPVLILITINQDVALKKYFRGLLETNKISEDISVLQEDKIKMFSFWSENKKEELEINIYDLLYIQSTGNYIHVFWMEKGKLKQLLIRATMDRTQKDLKKIKFIFRVYRSLLVNIRKIEKIGGNSRNGYKVRISGTDELLPISRGNIKTLKEIMRKKNF
jgi:LytTr DNA-binding domain